MKGQFISNHMGRHGQKNFLLIFSGMVLWTISGDMYFFDLDVGVFG